MAATVPSPAAPLDAVTARDATLAVGTIAALAAQKYAKEHRR